MTESENKQKLIEENLKQGNDIIVVYNNKGVEEAGENSGHACLISAISDSEVTLVDPSPKRRKVYTVPLVTLLEAMTDKFDGHEREFWIIHEKEKKLIIV